MMVGRCKVGWASQRTWSIADNTTDVRRSNDFYKPALVSVLRRSRRALFATYMSASAAPSRLVASWATLFVSAWPMLAGQYTGRGLADVDGRGQSGVEALDEPVGARQVRLVEHDELVATDPGDAVRAAHHREQPASRLLQDDVAGVVTERVVDVLEAVEVEVGHGQWLAGAFDARQTGLEQFVEQPPVGQAGQWIAEGECRQFRLQLRGAR